MKPSAWAAPYDRSITTPSLEGLWPALNGETGKINSPVVRQICDTDDRSERVARMGRYHGPHIEANAAGGSYPPSIPGP